MAGLGQSSDHLSGAVLVWPVDLDIWLCFCLVLIVEGTCSADMGTSFREGGRKIGKSEIICWGGFKRVEVGVGVQEGFCLGRLQGWWRR